MWLVPRLGAFCVHHTTMHPVTLSVYAKPHIVRCVRILAVTCHLHFLQNDRGLLRTTAVAQGWNGYRNKSQDKRLTLEKKSLPPFLLALYSGQVTLGISVAAKAVHEGLRWRGSGLPLWKLVPLSEGPWEEGISDSWMVCPFLEESQWASGSWVTLLQVLLFVDS